jgi:hypothetical protein
MFLHLAIAAAATLGAKQAGWVTSHLALPGRHAAACMAYICTALPLLVLLLLRSMRHLPGMCLKRQRLMHQGARPCSGRGSGQNAACESIATSHQASNTWLSGENRTFGSLCGTCCCLSIELDTWSMVLFEHNCMPTPSLPGLTSSRIHARYSSIMVQVARRTSAAAYSCITQ